MHENPHAELDSRPTFTVPAMAFFALGVVLLVCGAALAAPPAVAGDAVAAAGTSSITPADPHLVIADPVPLCREDETPQVCRQTDPCTGQVFFDVTCCPQGTLGVCKIGITRNGCITGTQAVCLGVV